MTRSETIILVDMVITAYPNSDKFNNETAINDFVNLWAKHFEDNDVVIVSMALERHISTCKFPPAIAELKEIILEICNPDIIPPDEAWEMVALYIDTSSEYGSFQESDFPIAIAKAIKAIGYSNLRTLRVRRYDHHERQAGLDRVSFIQAYEPEYTRARKNAMLPCSLQIAIAHTQAVFTGEARLLFEKTKSNLEAKQREEKEKIHALTNRHLYSFSRISESKNSESENADFETHQNDNIYLKV